jgi:hypothetical protein
MTRNVKKIYKKIKLQRRFVGHPKIKPDLLDNANDAPRVLFLWLLSGTYLRWNKRLIDILVCALTPYLCRSWQTLERLAAPETYSV